MMRLDIALITYNQEQFIAQALESILLQTIDTNIQMRLIVADDSSTDRTLEIIKSYESQSSFPFVYLLSEQNIGIAANYKRIFEVADSDFIAILEGDDWWCDVNRIQKHISYLSTHTDVVYTKNAMCLYYENDKTYKPFLENEIKYVTLRDLLFNNQLLGNLSSCVFKTKYLKELDNRVFHYSTILNGVCDWFIGLDILRYGYGYLFSDIMSVYRINTGYNVSRKELSSDNELQECKRFYDYANQLLEYKYNIDLEQVYQRKKNEIREYKEYLLYQKIEYYFSPLMVVLLKLFVNLGRYIKNIIKFLLPRYVFLKLKQKNK